MSVELKELIQPTPEEWNGLLSDFDDATVFHTVEWMRILADLFHLRPRFFTIIQGDKIVGVFPLFSMRKAFFNVMASPLLGWATPHLGPLAPEEALLGSLISLERIFAKEKVEYFEVSFTKEIQETALRNNGFKTERKWTYLLEIEPDPDKMWGKLKSKCRNMVRKAEKNNVTVTIAQDSSWIDEYYEMAKDVYDKSSRLPPISKHFLQKVWAVFHPQRRVRVLLAQYNGKVIAGAVFLIYNQTVYYWDGVSYRRYNQYAPNNLLQWELIKWASENGLVRYNMIGANIPSIAKFKASFGPKMVAYTYAYRNCTPRAAIGRSLYLRMMPTIRRIEKYWKS